MSEVPYLEAPAAVARPLAPAEEVAGPAFTQLVYDLRRTVEGMNALLYRARREAQERYISTYRQGQCDANGDVAIPLFQVPQGATAWLVYATLDESGFTPAAPDTSANLWHAIYAAESEGLTPGQLEQVGNLMACKPDAPTVDAQLPYSYSWGDTRAGPSLVGPQTFYAAVDAATANRVIAVRFCVYLEQPEP